MNLYRLLFILILLTGFVSCDYYVVNSYKHDVGYLDPSTSLDSGFEVCYEENILEFYYNRKKPASFEFGKDSLRNYFQANYDNKGIVNESGYVTFRFIVNCEGEVGRFHMYCVGKDYKTKKFHDSLTEQLYQLLSTLDTWQPLTVGDVIFDSHIYYTFKIENGELAEILP